MNKKEWMNPNKNFLKSFRMLFLVLVIFLFLFHNLLSYTSRKEQGKEEAGRQPDAQPIVISDDSIYAGSDNFELKQYTTYEYDQYGNEIGEYAYDADGNLTFYEKTQYAADGEWLQKNTWCDDWQEEKVVERKLLYQNDRLSRIRTYTNGRLTSLTSYQYLDGKAAFVTAEINSDGEVASYTGVVITDGKEKEEELASYQYEADGSFSNYIYAKYDEKDRCVYMRYGKDKEEEKHLREMFIEYDDRKRTSREDFYMPVGHLNNYQINAYDHDGNQISGLRYHHTMNGGSIEFPEADMEVCEGYWADYSNGMPIWEMRYGYGSLDSFQLYRYDNMGRKILKMKCEESNSVCYRYLYRYEYNEEGNLAARYTYRIGKQDFTFQNADGTSVVLSFHADHGYPSTITLHYADGIVKEQYSYDGEGEMLWHDIYSYEKPETVGVLPYETVIYRCDIEGNLIEKIKQKSL